MDDSITTFIAGATFALTVFKVVAKILKDAKKK